MVYGFATHSATLNRSQGQGLGMQVYQEETARPAGCRISEIRPGSPAEAATIGLHDVVIEVNGKRLFDRDYDTVIAAFAFPEGATTQTIELLLARAEDVDKWLDDGGRVEEAWQEASVAAVLGAGGDVSISQYLQHANPADVNRHVLKNAVYDVMVPLTTRAPRDNEVNGKDYNFVTEAQFMELLDAGRFMEHGSRNGVYYGTLKPSTADEEEIARRASLHATALQNSGPAQREQTVAEFMGANAPPALAALTVTEARSSGSAADREKLQAAIYKIVPYTTRAAREGEEHGVQYFFVSAEEFAVLLARDFFLEHGERNGVQYGTPRPITNVATAPAAATPAPAVAAATQDGEDRREVTLGELLEGSTLRVDAGGDRQVSDFLAAVSVDDTELKDVRAYVRQTVYDITVPYTTREPREGEVDGVTYNFVSTDVFTALMSRGHFIESGKKGDTFYGTPKVYAEDLARAKAQASPVPKGNAVQLSAKSSDIEWSKTMV